MIFLIPLILLIVYLIFSFVKKEFNPLKWFKKEGNDVKIQSIKFVTGTDKESVISNYTEKIFVIVTIEKNNPDIERVDVIRINGNKKQTIILNFNENEAIFEIDEDEDLTNKQQYIVDYTIKEKPLNFLTNSKTISLNNEEIETIKNNESVSFIPNEEGVLIKDIKIPTISIKTDTSINFVDIMLENDPDVNLFGTSNVYFNPSFSDKNKFYIVRDGIRQGVNTENVLHDDENASDLFMISKYGKHKYLTNESNTSILFLDENEIKLKNLSSLNQDELSRSKILLNFREKKNLINT